MIGRRDAARRAGPIEGWMENSSQVWWRRISDGAIMMQIPRPQTNHARGAKRIEQQAFLSLSLRRTARHHHQTPGGF
jgi:hypothetical protein